MAREFTDAELEAAVDALADRDRLREAEAVVARAAPQLQRILAQALEPADAAERGTAVRTLLGEEARMGMMVGVAVGWALAAELSAKE